MRFNVFWGRDIVLSWTFLKKSKQKNKQKKQQHNKTKKNNKNKNGILG